MTKITQETVKELTDTIQKSNEVTSQMVELMGRIGERLDASEQHVFKIGERLDASEQHFKELIDLLKDQKTKKPEATASDNIGNPLNGENLRNLKGARRCKCFLNRRKPAWKRNVHPATEALLLYSRRKGCISEHRPKDTPVRCGTRHFFEEGSPNSANREEARSRPQKASQVYEHASIHLHEKWFVGDCRRAGRALSTEDVRIGRQGGAYAEPDYDSVLGCNRT